MNPPQANQIEISVYGPGEGECILVHCGDGQWIIIDSAMFNGEPFAEWYLRELGFDLATCVKLIICTHWHTDHVDGLSKLVKKCTNAKFVFSDAILSPEFKQMVARYLDLPADGEKIKLAHQEIKSVFEHINAIRGSAAYIPPVAASQDMKLLRLQSQGVDVKVDSLSPSHEDRHLARAAFAALIAPLNSNSTGISPLSENKASVVVRVRIGHHCILLGADLEQTGSELSGWNAVIVQFLPSKASLFKIPHHGSEGSYNATVWSDLVEPNAHAVITPFRTHDLPRIDQLTKIKGHSSTVYLSSVSKGARFDRRSEVQKTMKEVLEKHNLYRDTKTLSLVRFTADISGQTAWSTELIGTALQL